MSDKIKSQHLARKAILYIRQSSAYRVSHNLESQKLPYAMQQRLQQLGWREIEVVDEDLGPQLQSRAPARTHGSRSLFGQGGSGSSTPSRVVGHQLAKCSRAISSLGARRRIQGVQIAGPCILIERSNSGYAHLPQTWPKV
jgi:hypothetical protein